jgi:Spy/CpxP family protein refolding chaperone
MNKIVTLSLAAAFAVTASSAFAGNKPGQTCCANHIGKKECSEIYAKLNLTPDQKTKLDAFQQRCEKDGCTDDSMKKFFAEAKGVLTPEQYTQLEAECGKMEKHEAKSES